METCLQHPNHHTTRRRRLDSPPRSETKKRRRPTRPETKKAIRDLNEFEILNKIGEGTYGVVYRARDKKTNEIVAVKKLRTDIEQSEREAEILTSLRHSSVINLITGSSTFTAMEYAENDLKSLLEARRQPFSLGEIKCLMQQLLQGVAYLHRNQVIHRDLKTSNLLFNNRGELKICDFGIAFKFEKNRIPHAEKVVSLCYRAPELLLEAEEYSTAIDMWSVGCVMAELLSGEALFAGAKTEIDQLGKILGILGGPSEAIWAGFSKLRGVRKGLIKAGNRCNLLRRRFPVVSFTASPVVSGAGFDLLSGLLRYDPEKRMSAEEAVDHAWFREVPLPRCKELMPSFPANCGVVKKVEPTDSGSLGLFGL